MATRRWALRATGATLVAFVAGCSSRGTTPSPGRLGRYEVVERTEPVRADGAPVTDCESPPVDCDASASETVRDVVAHRTGCDRGVPVRHFERGLLVLSELVVEPPYDAVAFPPAVHDRLRAVAPRSVPTGFDGDANSAATGTTQTAESIPVYAQAVLREGGENGVTPDWPESC